MQEHMEQAPMGQVNMGMTQQHLLYLLSPAHQRLQSIQAIRYLALVQQQMIQEYPQQFLIQQIPQQPLQDPLQQHAQQQTATTILLLPV